jgi:UDP-N-acetylmuramate dehydrogenase
MGWTRSTSSCDPTSSTQSSAVVDPNISPDCPDNADILVTVPAGTVFDDFCAWAASEGLWGPENLSLIPGECGASAVQNIGAYGVEAKDIIADIRAYDRETGSFVNIDPATCGYGYRTSNFKTIWKGRYIITAVTYRLSRTPQPKLDYGGLRKVLEDRGVAVPSSGNSVPLRSTPAPPISFGNGPLPLPMCGGAHVPEEGTATPLSAQIIRDAIIDIRRKKLPAVEEIGSAGSFFCNPVISHEHFERIVAIAKEDNGPEYAVPHYDAPGGIKVPAAWMIEQCGFKGRRNGGAQVYQNQPLVIVNASGTATPEEIIGLEQEVIKAIQTKYGITLHPEVEHI